MIWEGVKFLEEHWDEVNWLFTDCVLPAYSLPFKLQLVKTRIAFCSQVKLARSSDDPVTPAILGLRA